MAPAKPITVLVCDDSALIRTLFSEMLNAEPDITVIGTATDPLDAREKIKRLNPDVLTLDIEMPHMDGLSFLEKIMTLRPMPVVMISTLTRKGAGATLAALEIGAVDYISKPDAQTRTTIAELQAELLAKVRAAASANITVRPAKAQAPQALTFQPPVRPQIGLIAMGASTGGVETLRDIFQVLPGNLPPILIVQHMPAAFTPSFAARLNGVSPVTVMEARDGVRLQHGHAYLAPGGKQMRLKRSGGDWCCAVETGVPVSGHCPSVDVLFQSVAEQIGDRAAGIILTGMGKDGAQGLLELRRRGGRTIGQNENTCVVYGMPRAAASIGAVETELPLAQIPHQLIKCCSQPA